MNYRFSDQLDLVKLQEFYDGDPRVAAAVFEAFVQETVTAVPDLDQLFVAGNVQDLKRLVHKIKPGFLYVGLSNLYEKLNAFEMLCERSATMPELREEFEAVRVRMHIELPWVQSELVRLKAVEV